MPETATASAARSRCARSRQRRLKLGMALLERRTLGIKIRTVFVQYTELGRYRLLALRYGLFSPIEATVHQINLILGFGQRGELIVFHAGQRASLLDRGVVLGLCRAQVFKRLVDLRLLLVKPRLCGARLLHR